MNFLLHVGMAQSGSTFLRNVLFANCSELNVISTRDIEGLNALYNPICSYEDYFWSEREAAAWLDKVSHPDKLNVVSFVAFSRPDMLSRSLVAQRLSRLCPGAKCLIVVRNQCDAMVSAYSQRARTPGTLLPSFNAFFESNIRDPKQSQFRQYYYGELVKTYEDLFGKQEVLVVPFELLKNDGPTFVERVSNFAGIRSPASVEQIRVNQRGSMSYVAFRRFAQRLCSPETLERYWLKIPYPLRQKIKMLINRGSRFEVTLSDNQKRLVGACFGASNEELSKRRDLFLIESYGYPAATTEVIKSEVPPSWNRHQA